MDELVFRVRDLRLPAGGTRENFEIERGLTMVHAGREEGATVLSMVLAGRMKPEAGEFYLYEDEATSEAQMTPGMLHKRVAFAGVDFHHQLEREVELWTVISEQASWVSPWWKLGPSSLAKIPGCLQALDVMGLEWSDDFVRHHRVSHLGVVDRVKLGIVLALIARPDPSLFIFDDIDQLRSLRARKQVLLSLRRLSREWRGSEESADPGLSCIAVTSNSDIDGICDHFISVTSDDYDAAHSDEGLVTAQIAMNQEAKA
ncbi:hypothetical protein [Corynebacterium atrinae]|uniref:hypothetical protein n=1 Tax=Corynebacterium atrinae TaxID=1336740 RepID=UPI0025B2EA86|nr:hypothetical protein [Corynebacterium atrinae]